MNAVYKKFPYRTTFPDSSESPQNSQTLEDALHASSWRLNRVWKEDGPWGRKGQPTTDADRAIVVNRNTGYRWIMHRGRPEVEFQTPAMLETIACEQGVEIFLSLEEAEALARSAQGKEPGEIRQKALTDQALDQIAYICRQVRNRVTAGERQVDRRYTALRTWSDHPPAREEQEGTALEPRVEPTYPQRPLGDPDNLSLKEAGELLGKARNTLYGWYRSNKFPPAVDVAPFLGESKPILVVPRYRLQAWLDGERMPAIFEKVFNGHGLREAPWQCWSVKRGASKQDVAFWVARRNLKEGRSKTGKRIFGEGLEDGLAYDVSASRVP